MSAAAADGRPPASVIVPFAGPAAALALVIGALARLGLGPQDEILIADNSSLAAPPPLPPAITLVPAVGVRAPGFARNRAAARARGEWLVFLDADTIPDPGLLGAYLRPVPPAGVGLLAGAIVDVPGGAGRAAQHAAQRGQMRAEVTLARTGRPYAQTANCAVRAAAFAAVGGFDESARYGEDADLAFRLAAAGWGLESRAAARVEHVSRPTLPGLLTQLSGHGAGAAWLAGRYPGEFRAPSAGRLAARCGRAALRATTATLGGRRAEAASAGLELVETLAFEGGRLRSNRPRPS